MVRIHSPRPNFSGSTQGPPWTLLGVRILDSGGRCGRVLIDLPSDDLDDLSRPDQEVW